jgi:hypothetical protein
LIQAGTLDHVNVLFAAVDMRELCDDDTSLTKIASFLIEKAIDVNARGED